MAKHAVPKRKSTKARTSRRYKTFVGKNQTRLRNMIQLVNCSNCGKKRQLHHVCTNCGMYRGRQIFDLGKQVDKITKIKA